MKLPLNLVVFTTSVGHYGRKDIYKSTVNDLFSKVDKNIFSGLIAHIKVRPGEEETADEAESYFNKLEFKVIRTNSDFRRNDHLRHGQEYINDIYKTFSDPSVQKNQYTLWLEDDWIIKTKNNDLNYYLWKACDLLAEERDLMTLRINSKSTQDFNDEQIIRRKDYILQNVNFTQYGPCFTFQPNISRSRDLWLAWRTVLAHDDKVGHLHIELKSGIGMKSLSDSQTPFGFFDFNSVKSIHIGEPPFEKLADI